MESTEVLVEAFGRLTPQVEASCAGLDGRQLEFRPDQDANSIGWLLWHLSRVQDAHVADLINSEQIWFKDNWQSRFALDLPDGDTGFGHSSEDVAKVCGLSSKLLLGYYAQVHERTMAVLPDIDLERVVDESYAPPVTAGARLISVIGECYAHVGQAAYVRGLVKRHVSS